MPENSSTSSLARAKSSLIVFILLMVVGMIWLATSLELPLEENVTENSSTTTTRTASVKTVTRVPSNTYGKWTLRIGSGTRCGQMINLPRRRPDGTISVKRIEHRVPVTFNVKRPNGTPDTIIFPPGSEDEHLDIGSVIALQACSDTATSVKVVIR